MILPLRFDNRGTVDVRSGTLGPYFGGRHTGRFSAAPGARIVLAGDNVIAAAVATSGQVDVTSGSFSIADSASYVHAAGNSMSVARLDVASLGRFDNNGWFGINDWNNPAKVNNQGQLNNRGSLAAVSLANSGQIVNAAGADMRAGQPGRRQRWPDRRHRVLQRRLRRIDHPGQWPARGAGRHLHQRRARRLGHGRRQCHARTVRHLEAGQLAGNDDGTGRCRHPVHGPRGPGLAGIRETAPGNIEIEIASASVYDRLQVSGNASLNALVEFVLLPGYTPSDGDAFPWLNAASISGFAVPRFFGLPTGWHGDLIADPLGGTMRFVLSNEPAVDGSSQIPLAGSVSVPVGTVASNGDWAGTPSLDRLDNAGWFINQPGATAWIGDLANQAGGVIANHGTLVVTHGVDNAGELRNKPGAELTVFGGFTNRGHFAQIVNQGTFVVDGTVNNDYGWYYYSGTIRNTAGRFVVAPGGLVTGGGSYYQLDQATDPASVPVTQVDGRLAAADIRIDGGFLTGSGTLAGPVRLSATVQPGNSPGTLTIEGNLLASASRFEIELAGVGNADRLHVTGSAAFSNGSDVWFILQDGYRPHAGDSFVWLVVDGSASGLDNLDWYVLDGDRVWSRDYPMPGMPIAFSGDRIAFGSASPVPEVPSWAMWLAGVGGLCSYVGRRRRRDLVGSGR